MIYLVSEQSGGLHHYTMLDSSSDNSFLESIITRGSDHDKASLCMNPHLSDKQLEILAGDACVYVRSQLASRKNLPPALLSKLRADKAEEVRVHALSNPLTSFAEFKNSVLTEKFTTRSKQLFCDEFRALEDIEVFRFLWTTVRNSQTKLTYTLAKTYWMPEMRNKPVDPECIHVVHEQIRNGNTSNALREQYARSKELAIPELLDQLKDDPCRPVINAVAGNKSAWVSTHEYLVDNHKSPSMRITVACATRDNTLLNKIYHGTKNEDIRKQVEENPAFVNLKP